MNKDTFLKSMELKVKKILIFKQMNIGNSCHCVQQFKIKFKKGSFNNLSYLFVAFNSIF